MLVNAVRSAPGMKLLLSRGADPNSKGAASPSVISALTECCVLSWPEGIQLLLEHSSLNLYFVSLHPGFTFPVSAMYAAASAGCVPGLSLVPSLLVWLYLCSPGLKMLLERGARLDHERFLKFGWKHNKYEILETLIEASLKLNLDLDFDVEVENIPTVLHLLVEKSLNPPLQLSLEAKEKPLRAKLIDLLVRNELCDPRYLWLVCLSGVHGH